MDIDQDDSQDDQYEQLGIVHYFGLSKDGQSCGYCKTNRSPECTYGLWAHYLPTKCYQLLIDRNWRRCGKYLYKPINNRLCCPMYTIRCDTTGDGDFQLKKSQRKVLKKFLNYLRFDTKKSNYHGSKSNDDSMVIDRNQLTRPCSKPVSKHAEDNEQQPQPQGQRDRSKPNTSKKKYQRQQRLIEKCMKRENCTEERAKQLLRQKSERKCPKMKSLEDYFDDICRNDESYKHTFRTRIVRARTQPNDSNGDDFKLYKRYQMQIHGDAEDELSYRSYKRFLIDTPLNFEVMKFNRNNRPSNHRIASDQMPSFYGSYHQLYLIDNRLIAVGVIDLLPQCLSSVYFFYDPNYAFLNLGVFSALSEIALVRRYHRYLAEFRYYYMGFYIHECPKMRYKSQYSPSYLLCSETFEWCPIDDCLKLLDQHKYARFSHSNSSSESADSNSNNQIDNIKLLYRNMIIKYLEYKMAFATNDNQDRLNKLSEKLREYLELIGDKCSSMLLYYLDDDE